MDVVVASQGYVGATLAMRVAGVVAIVLSATTWTHTASSVSPPAIRTWRAWPPHGSARFWTPGLTPCSPTPLRGPASTSR